MPYVYRIFRLSTPTPVRNVLKLTSYQVLRLHTGQNTEFQNLFCATKKHEHCVTCHKFCTAAFMKRFNNIHSPPIQAGNTPLPLYAAKLYEHESQQNLTQLR